MTIIAVACVVVLVLTWAVGESDGGVVLSCLRDFDTARKWGVISVVETTSAMGGYIPQLTDSEGVIYRLFQSLRVDDPVSGMAITRFQDKNTSPFGDAADKCDKHVLKCESGSAPSCGIWTGVTTSGGGDELNNQLGALHHYIRKAQVDPTEYRIVVVLYTNTRPHISTDGPSGFNPIPATGNYDCQTTLYPSLDEVNNEFVQKDVRLVAIVNPSDVEFYEDLFEPTSFPFSIYPWGINSDETLNNVLAGIDRIVCDGDRTKASCNWDKVVKKEGGVEFNATNVQQGEKASREEYLKIYGMQANGTINFLRKKYDE